LKPPHPGTLFLDELGNMPLNVQEKLLRVVEYGLFERVGGSKSIKVDVRIIGATNKNLKQEAEEGRFLGDLLDRLAFEVLRVPPLRERDQDVLLLANHFAARMHSELERPGLPSLSLEAEQALLDYAWPGNVRELKNVIERAVYKSGSDVIGELLFDPFSLFEPSRHCQPEPAAETGQEAADSIDPEDIEKPAIPPPPEAGLDFKDAIAEYEQGLIRHALQNCRFNQKQAALELGLTYHQLRGLLRKHGGIEKFGG
jgi:psp operon transcriptional activator